MQVYNQYMPIAVKMFRVRDYQRSQLIVQGNLAFESYRPGDTASGLLTVSNPDGSPFNTNPQFSYSVVFENSTVSV